jgi:hypothetical protein
MVPRELKTIPNPKWTGFAGLTKRKMTGVLGRL